MKKAIAISVSAALIVFLAACSNTAPESGKPAATQAETTQAAATDAPRETKAQSTTNTTYNVGEFSVFVPEGWNAVAVPDHEDPSKTATNDIKLIKGSSSEASVDPYASDEGQSFYITYLNKEDFAKAQTQKERDAEDFAVKDMDDLTLGNYTWKGYSVSPIGADVYCMWTPRGEGGYYASISTAYGLSLDDEDVKTILASLD